jgi:signal transduction histidine kinase
MQQQQKKNNIALAHKTLEIEQQSNKLSEVNQLKDKLFSIIAHDLRSPFRSLIGLLNLADMGALTEEDFKHFLPELSKNVSYTSGLLDNLLYWAKSQMEEASIEPEIFDVQEIADNKIGLFEKQAMAKNIVLENKINSKVSVFADKNMVDLVLRNLMANAVKFCNIHGKITIAATQKSEFLIVSVTDTGNGISSENMEKLFGNQTFTTRGTSNEKGTGLGLMLCKEFVEKNGGKFG